MRWRTTAATAPAGTANLSVWVPASATRTRWASARGNMRRTAAVSRDSCCIRWCHAAIVSSPARMRDNGLADTFERAGVTLIHPGCGACIGCGPGVSENPDQVTISAINRNYKGRSGPGKLWLASPLTVAASAFTGHITAYRPGMFQEMKQREPALAPA